MVEIEQRLGQPTFQVAVVLLNYMGWQDTLRCLDSLLELDYPFKKIIVCDNASPNGSLKELRSGILNRLPVLRAANTRWGSERLPGLFEISRSELDEGANGDAQCILINNMNNRGFAAGNNTGLRFALLDPEIDYVWILNNDTVVPPNSLRSLVEAAQLRDEVGLWGATVVYDADRDVVQALGGGTLNARTGETRHLGAFTSVQCVQLDSRFVSGVEAEMDFVVGASMFASRRWIETVGLLNERYFLYYEELDWALRGHGLMQIGYAPACLVWHKEGASIGTGPDGGSPLSVYHLSRSRILFARRYLGLSRMPSVVCRALWCQAKLALKGRLGVAFAGARGVIAGLIYSERLTP